jgi:hypothetical protein
MKKAANRKYPAMAALKLSFSPYILNPAASDPSGVLRRTTIRER